MMVKLAKLTGGSQEEKVVWETNQQASHNCQSSSPTVIIIASFPSAIVITIALHRFYRCHQQYHYQQCPGNHYHHRGPVVKLKILVLLKLCLYMLHRHMSNISSTNIYYSEYKIGIIETGISNVCFNPVSICNFFALAWQTKVQPLSGVLINIFRDGTCL